MKTNLRTGDTGIIQRSGGSEPAPATWLGRPAGARAVACLVSGLVVVAVLAGCDHEKPPAPPVATRSVEDRFPIKVGDRVVQMQVAALPQEQQHGLMYRTAMGNDEGMIFVFTAPQPQGFYMRNCPLPLDIGYFDATGELKEIYPMYPFDERSVSSHSRSIQFCLEMNQGWFKQAGVRAGAKLDLKAVADALRARGLRPEAAGLN